jgi:ectoine hydroxylase-related dioxygenase (phytanoyl-CoA dioxygenase family)
LVVPAVLGPDEAADLSAAFDSLPMVADYSEIIGMRAEAAERQLVGDRRFLGVATSPRLVAGVREILGDDLQLIDYVAMEIGPRSGRHRAWHVDLPFFTYPTCLTVIAAVYLEDMVDELGPLYVVPGSHAWERVPDAGEASDENGGEIAVRVPAGTGVLFNSQLWHTGTRNTSERPRRALFLHYAHYWMKRMDEFHQGPLPETVTRSDDPLVRQVFGLELASMSIWGGQYTRERERIRV